jgi:hypothetical protein
MARKTLIMQNSGVLYYHHDCMETDRLMMISFRPQRCCYQAVSDHMPACLPAYSMDCIFRVSNFLRHILNDMSGHINILFFCIVPRGTEMEKRKILCPNRARITLSAVSS